MQEIITIILLQRAIHNEDAGRRKHNDVTVILLQRAICSKDAGQTRATKMQRWEAKGTVTGMVTEVMEDELTQGDCALAALEGKKEKIQTPKRDADNLRWKQEEM